MSRVKLIVQEGYGSTYRPYNHEATVLDLNVKVPDTHDILGLVRTDFDPEEDGSVRSSDELIPAIRHERINTLVGMLLELVDATFTDKVQRKAMRDLFMRVCWDFYEGQTAALKEPWRIDKFPHYKKAFSQCKNGCNSLLGEACSDCPK